MQPCTIGQDARHCLFLPLGGLPFTCGVAMPFVALHAFHCRATLFRPGGTSRHRDAFRLHAARLFFIYLRLRYSRLSLPSLQAAATLPYVRRHVTSFAIFAAR